MKVLKPQTLSLLHRVVDDPRQPQLVVVVLGFFAFGRERLLPEATLWPFAAMELGADAGLDECLPKTRGEILVGGRCYAPGGAPVGATYVRATVGSLDKRLAVIGDREWRDGLPSAPQPFVEMPLTWERAFGGPGFARNPLGKGVPPVPHMRSAFPLPNIETWGRLVAGPADTPDPAGLLPLDSSWPQRARKAGTYDEAWLRERFPGFAADVDPAFFNAAPADQQRDGFFAGGEPFRFENMHPGKPALEGRLPSLRARAFVERRGEGGSQLGEVPLQLDTVWFFPHAERGVLVFRGVVPVAEDDAADVETLLVAAERLDAPRTPEHYRDELARRLDPDRGHVHSLHDRGLVPEAVAGEEDELPEQQNEMQELLAGERLQERYGQRGGERMRQQVIAEARAAVAAAGLDPEAYVRVPEPPPPLPDPKDVEAVLKRIEEEEAAAEAQRAELDAMKAAMEADARRACEEAGVDYDAAVAAAKAEAVRPPKRRADEELARLRGVLEEAKAHGAEAPELEAKLASGELLAMLHEADRAAAESYQDSVHLMDAPAPRQGDEAARARDRVVAAVAAGASFAEVDVTGADLSGLDLSGADLAGGFLAGASLRGARMAATHCDRAVLAHADLSGADLEGASLRGANLGGAVFRGARLTKADLTGAVLQRASLSGGDFEQAILEDANLFEATLQDVIFRRARLCEVNFLKCDLRGCSFAGADLTKANFVEVDLTGVDFEGATLELVTLVGCRVDGANFARANLGKLHAVNGCSFTGCDFRGASLSDAFLRGANLAGATFDESTLRGADLSECELHAASLRAASAVDARFVRADLTGAEMDDTDLRQASLSKAIVRGTDLTGANLFRADLSRLVVDDTTKLAGANLKQARIHPKRNADGRA